MFKGKQKAAALPEIRINAEDGSRLFDGRLTALKLKEEMVIALSIQFFNDPEPCEIHRGAVAKRVFMDIMDRVQMGEKVCLSDMDPELRSYFDCYDKAHTVELYRE